MRRREFVKFAGGAVLAMPLGARAQPAAKLWRIGMLTIIPADLNAANLDAFRKGLKDLGYVEGKNYVIDYRFADGRPEQPALLVAELVRLPADIIVTGGTSAAVAAKAATKAIPVVMATSGDPVGAGIVASLARPGGNITGLSSFGTELAAKRVELVKELLPGLSRVGLVTNMGNPVSPLQWEETKREAAVLGLQAELFDVRDAADIARASDAAVAHKVGAVIVTADGVLRTNRQLIVDLAARSRMPTLYGAREFAEAGGLISFRTSFEKLYFRAATFVDKILKGAKPGDLPVEQPTTLEMVINLKTAKALGLTMPFSVLARADEVIE